MHFFVKHPFFLTIPMGSTTLYFSKLFPLPLSFPWEDNKKKYLIFANFL